MKFSRFLGVLCALCICFHATAQNTFLVKGGPSVAQVSSNNYSELGLGGGLGFEKQLGQNTSISTMIEYLSMQSTSDKDILNNLRDYYSVSSRPFLISLAEIHSEFRLYSKSELRGFFLGAGLGIGSLERKRITIDKSASGVYSSTGFIRNRDLSFTPNFAIGYNIALSELCGVEISAGFKKDVANNIDFFPFLARFKYEF